jgi:hypothetical protein
MRRVLFCLLLVASLSIAPVAAQAPPSTGMRTQDIVPQPNSGRAPEEAGDRGGALQLLIPGLFVLAVSGAVLHLRRQSRKARYSDGSKASQAALPSMNPER